MKIGNENRTKLIVAVSLMVLALVLVGRMLFSSGGTSSAAANSPVSPSVAPARVVHVRPGAQKKAKVARSLDPALRYDWLKASEDTEYQGKGRNIFRAQAEIIPTPAGDPVTTGAENPSPTNTGPPPPPPINIKFFGFANRPGESKKIFLSQGEDVFIAVEGDIVDRRYKVLVISPMSVEIEDVLTNNRQSIPLTQG